MNAMETLEGIKTKLRELRVPFYEKSSSQIYIEMGPEEKCIDICIVPHGPMHIVEAYDPVTEDISKYLIEVDEIINWVVPKYNAWKLLKKG